MAFTVADQCLIIKEAEGFDNINKTRNANVEFAKIILDNQTAEFDTLSDPNNPKQVRIWWKEICRQAMVDCTDNCTIAGTEADLGSVDYEITECKQTAPIVLGENKFRHSTAQRVDFVAQELASRLRDADEFLAKELVASAYAFSGTTAFEGGYTFNVTRNSLEIPAVEFGAGLEGFIAQFTALNQLDRAILIDGGNLYQKAYGMDMNTFGGAELNFDLFNITSNPDTVNSTFLISPSAMALKTIAYHEETPVTYHSGANITKFKVASPNLPGVEYDVYYKTECVGNDILEKWAVQVNYGIFQSPLSGCNATDTGVYLLDCV